MSLCLGCKKGFVNMYSKDSFTATIFICPCHKGESAKLRMKGLAGEKKSLTVNQNTPMVKEWNSEELHPRTKKPLGLYFCKHHPLTDEYKVWSKIALSLIE